MVRSVGIFAIAAGLAWTGLAEAQSSSPQEKARYINVSEEGKPSQRCKVLKTWREANGAPAFQVQAVDTGEIMTILGTAPKGVGSDPREMTTRIFRWGRGSKPPAGAPMPPPTAAPLTSLPSSQPPLVPQPSRSAPVVATPRPTSVAPIVQKPIPSPPATTAQPTIITPNTLTASKPALPPVVEKTAPVVTSKTPQLTPMGTQVVQYSSASPQAKLPDLPKASDSQPRLAPLPAGSTATSQSCNCPCPQTCASNGRPCNTSCQSSCVCNTPSPMRQPLIGRLFKSNSPCPCTTVACQPSAAVPTQSVGTSTVKPGAAPPPPLTVVSEQAKPNDWRQSWGKVEPWKGSAQTTTVKQIEVSRRVESKPVNMGPSTQPDPLKAPDQYRDMVMSSRLSNSKIPQQRPAPVGKKLFGTKSTTPAMQPAHPVEEIAIVNAPPNSGLPQGKMIVIPADEPNAFSSPQSTPAGQEKTKLNAFDRQPDPQQQQGGPPSLAGVPPSLHNVPPALPGITMGPLPPGPRMNMPTPPLPATAAQRPMNMSPDAGVPSAMGNAFTLSGTSRPIPADFGGTPQEPNGFDPANREGQGSPPQAYRMGTGMPGAYRPQMSNMMAMGARAPMGVNPLMSVPPTAYNGQAVASVGTSLPPSGVPQQLAALKDSVRPSEREAAAEQLSELNWRIQPQVVESLMKSARDDPAATVRAACVHALAHMKADTPATLALVRELKSDRDAAVRQEAEEALHALGDSGIQQATHK